MKFLQGGTTKNKHYYEQGFKLAMTFLPSRTKLSTKHTGTCGQEDQRIKPPTEEFLDDLLFL